MPNPRYQPIKVFTRGGRRIVQIKDGLTGRDLFIYRRSARYLHWDRLDVPVEDRELSAAASKALRRPPVSPPPLPPTQMSLGALKGVGAS